MGQTVQGDENMELSLQNEQKQIMSQKMIQSMQVLQMTAMQLDS